MLQVGDQFWFNGEYIGRAVRAGLDDGEGIWFFRKEAGAIWRRLTRWNRYTDELHPESSWVQRPVFSAEWVSSDPFFEVDSRSRVGAPTSEEPSKLRKAEG